MEILTNETNATEAKTKPSTALCMFISMCKDHHIGKHGEVGKFEVGLTEFTKKCSERWKTMTEKEKRRFNLMADADKKACKEARRKMKDPNAPIKPMSSFFWFCEAQRPKIKASNKEMDLKGLAKELGKRWAEVDPEVKAKCEAAAKKDKERYEEEFCKYQTTLKNTKKEGIQTENIENESIIYENKGNSFSNLEAKIFNTSDDDNLDNEDLINSNELKSAEETEDASNTKENVLAQKESNVECEWSNVNLAKKCRRSYQHHNSKE